MIFCFLFFVHLISVLEVKLIYTVTWNGYINSWIQHRSLIVFLLLLLSFKWIQLLDKTKTTKYKILFTVTFPDVSWRKVNFGGARILTELFVPEREEDWKLQLIYTSLKNAHKTTPRNINQELQTWNYLANWQLEQLIACIFERIYVCVLKLRVVFLRLPEESSLSAAWDGDAGNKTTRLSFLGMLAKTTSNKSEVKNTQL